METPIYGNSYLHVDCDFGDDLLGLPTYPVSHGSIPPSADRPPWPVQSVATGLQWNGSTWGVLKM